MVEQGGSGASHKCTGNISECQAMSPQNERLHGAQPTRLRKTRRRLTSGRQLIDRYTKQTSVSEWAQHLAANERGQRSPGTPLQERAVDGIRITDQGTTIQHSQAGNSSAGAGRGAGLGAALETVGETEDQTTIEEMSSGEESKFEGKLVEAPEPRMSKTQAADPVPAKQRRVEPSTTSIQKIFLPIINSDAFYYVIMSAIFVNCIQLAATSPLEPSPDPEAMQDANEAIDMILFVTFSVEFVLKHLALYPMGYWSDSWNKLDGVIVVVGYLQFVPGVGEYPAIRVLRAIRPLRVIGKLEGMKKILSTIGNAVNGLVDTLMLCGLIFFMFGIVGCSLFAGVTRHRCFIPTAGNSTSGKITYGAPWTLNEDQERPCGGWFTCPEPQKCFFHDEAPNYSITSFDNIPIGFLTIFVAITLEGWVDVMYLIQDGYSFLGATVYFHLLIILGSLFTLNLALAVISEAYESQEEDWEVASREAAHAMRGVKLLEEAIRLENLGIKFRAANTEREGIENAKDLAAPEEVSILQSDLDDCIATMVLLIGEAKQLGVMLIQEDCTAEAAMVMPIVELLEEFMDGLAEQDEEPEPTAADVEALHMETRKTMHAVQAQLHLVATANWFDKLIMFFIIFNTVCLAMDHAGEDTIDGVKQAVVMSESLDDALTGLNYLFIAVFTIEVIVKLGGLGPRTYIQDTFNIFDFFIVIMSFVELGFADNSSLSAMRTFRLARVLKLAKNWKSLRDLINTIVETLPAIWYLSILLVLFMGIMAVAGMMFFGGKFDKDEIDGRHLFDNFGVAMLTVFQMLTGENWNSVLYDGINSTSYFCVAYFLIVQILGGFVILNLFLAILLSNFAEDEVGHDSGEAAYPSIGDILEVAKAACVTSSKVAPEPSEAYVVNGHDTACDVSEVESLTPTLGGDFATPILRSSKATQDIQTVPSMGTPLASMPVEADGTADLLDVPATVSDFGADSSTESSAGRGCGSAQSPQTMELSAVKSTAVPGSPGQQEDAEVGVPRTVEQWPEGRSMGCFPADSLFRRRLALMLGWSQPGVDTVDTPFSNFILVMIVVSSITLAIDEPSLDQDGGVKTALNICDLLFTAIFTVEMVLKIIVYGFIFTDDAYLKDGWNSLDFFIVVTSIFALPSNPVLGLSTDSSGPVASLRVLRTFRALRPLRMINRAPGLKVVVDAIFKCLPAFINIGLVSWLVYLVFAIMGVQLWAGKFWSCNDTSVESVKQCTGLMADGTARVWANKPLNFDNVLNAQLTLFEVASLEIWLDVMYAAMDVPEKLGEQPQRDQSWYFAAYFVLFIIVGSFLMMNLFVGAVVDNFNRIKSSMDREGAVMTDEQEAFVNHMKTMFTKKPTAKAQAPDPLQGTVSLVRYKVFQLISLEYNDLLGPPPKLRSCKREPEAIFDQVIMVLIAGNILVMAMPVWVQPASFTEVGSTAAIDAQATAYNTNLETCNVVFNFLFLVELLLKLLGLGVKQYFETKMNTFDCCIVVVSLIGFIIDRSLSGLDPGLVGAISVIKAGRVVRIFRLAMRVKGIRQLLETLIYTLPSLFNVCCLLLIVVFIFTVLGMAFFGNQEFSQPPFELYEAHAHFNRFHIGFFTLFRMSTGESWNGIMHDSMENVSPYAWVYYFTYMIVGSNLLFQLIVAVVLEQFSAATDEEEALVKPDHIEMFSLTWREMDPQNTSRLTIEQISILVQSLDPPLGIMQPGIDRSPTEVSDFITESELAQEGDDAHYVATFFKLVNYAYKKKFKSRWKGTLDQSILDSLTAQLNDNEMGGIVSLGTSPLGVPNDSALEREHLPPQSPIEIVNPFHSSSERGGKLPPLKTVPSSVDSVMSFGSNAEVSHLEVESADRH